MDAKTVLNELIDELEALREQIIEPYKNNDNIDFIPTLYAGESIGVETAIKYAKLKLEALSEEK
jgi:hypothetical protein